MKGNKMGRGKKEPRVAINVRVSQEMDKSLKDKLKQLKIDGIFFNKSDIIREYIMLGMLENKSFKKNN
jgi:hypothetical protein